MDKNKILVEKIMNAIGGIDNVKSLTHCMTRLRFELNNNDIPVDDDIKKIDGVLGVVRNPKQYQIIIGQNVSKVYDVICHEYDIEHTEQIEEKTKQDEKKEKLTLKVIGKNIMTFMAGCMTPMIPVLLVAGMFRALNALLGPEILGLYTAESDMYVLLDFLYDAGFYFMPILIGFNGAKILGANQLLGAYMGSVLIAPDLINLVNGGGTFSVFGIPCTLSNYSQTAVPAMLCVFVMSELYKFIKKYMPDALTTVVTPFLTMLIMTPVGLCVLAPLGTNIGTLISGGLFAFSNATGFIGLGLMAALWEFLVMTGMHLALMMPMMASFFETGTMSGVTIAGSFATWAIYGVALGATIRIKNKKDKSTFLGFFVSGLVGGITEPTLYGLCFNYKRCFITMMIGAFVGGAYASITNVTIYIMTNANFLGLLGFVGGTTSNIVNGVISCMLSFVIAAIATYFVGFTKEEIAEN